MSSHQHNFINPNSASLSCDTPSSLAAFKHRSSHASMIIHCVPLSFPWSLVFSFFFLNAVHIYEDNLHFQLLKYEHLDFYLQVCP